MVPCQFCAQDCGMGPTIANCGLPHFSGRGLGRVGRWVSGRFQDDAIEFWPQEGARLHAGEEPLDEAFEAHCHPGDEFVCWGDP